MTDVPFKGDRLKEKGILGELQAFLRMKMVEKLQTTELASTSKQVKFSPKNDAINIMVYEYLKHHKMFYTSSVFASECLSIQQSSTEYLDNCEWKDILNSLGVTIPEDCDNVRAINDGKTCLLNWVVDTFGKKSLARPMKTNLANALTTALKH
uniref:LisH domain-containing protein n=1 Tax=Daphnia galeata TaxID=27404 RepID=A0A8J2S3D9_9CRUS|nr:unnamed protein product [Daphnia galeata]